MTWGYSKGKKQAYDKDKSKVGISGEGVKTNSSDIQFTDKKKTLTEQPNQEEILFAKNKLKLPAYQSDKWNELKKHVENQFDRTFNSVRFDNLQTVVPDWYEYMDYKEITDEDLKDYFGGSIKDKTEDEIEEAKQELQHEQMEIIWGTVFEAADENVAEKIRENKEIIQELGLTIIDLGNSEKANNYNTGVFLGVRSAGHDFYESYWVPLWKIFDWLPE